MKSLEAYRLNKELTQEELARLLGKSQGQVSHWLRGTRIPSTKNVLLIAERTGLSVKKLLEETT